MMAKGEVITERSILFHDVAGHDLEIRQTDGGETLIRYGENPALTLAGYAELKKKVWEGLFALAGKPR